jgi:hypothetical protein
LWSSPTQSRRTAATGRCVSRRGRSPSSTARCRMTSKGIDDDGQRTHGPAGRAPVEGVDRECPWGAAPSSDSATPRSGPRGRHGRLPGSVHACGSGSDLSGRRGGEPVCGFGVGQEKRGPVTFVTRAATGVCPPSTPPGGSHRPHRRGAVRRLAPDVRTLATGSQDRTVLVWNLTDPRHPRSRSRLTGYTDGVMSVALAPVGRALAAASSDKKVRL